MALETKFFVFHEVVSRREFSDEFLTFTLRTRKQNCAKRAEQYNSRGNKTLLQHFSTTREQWNINLQKDKQALHYL